MSATIIVLIGFTRIAFVSYAYSINIYYIPLLVVTGKRPVKYVYILPVSGFAYTIASNSQIFVTLFWELPPVVPWVFCWNQIVQIFAHTPITLGLLLMFLIN